MLRKVVLPEPDGPITARNSPAFTASEKLRSACVSMRSVRNTLLTLDMESMEVPRSVADEYGRRVLVVAHVGEHDRVARGEAVANLDLADRGRAELDRHAHGIVVAHHVDEARLGVGERAARHLE